MGKVSYMGFRRKKIGDEEYLWGAHAAKILRICGDTFYRRFRRNLYPDIDAIKVSTGIKYRLRDVVSAAHPGVSDKKLDELVILYRLEGFRLAKKKSTKRGRAKK